MVYRRGSHQQASERSFMASSPTSAKLVTPRLSVADFRLIMSAIYSVRHGREVFLNHREIEHADRIMLVIQDTLEHS